MPQQQNKFVFLGYWPRRVRAPRRGQKQEKSYSEKYDESPLKDRCHERDYTRKCFCPLFAKIITCQGPINQSEVKLYKIIKQNIKIAKDRDLNGSNFNIPVNQRVHLSSGIKGTCIVKIIYNHISFSLNNFMLPKI